MGVFEDVLDLFLETAVAVGGAHGGAVVSRLCCVEYKVWYFPNGPLLKRLFVRFAPFIKVGPRRSETRKGRELEGRGGCHAGLVVVT